MSTDPGYDANGTLPLTRDGRAVSDRGGTVCVIGAGASGLAAVKNLLEHGFGVDCYERETGVGGAWNWRHDRSPVSAGTHLISSKPMSQYPDFPMPDAWPDYPAHGLVLSYLERYAEHFELKPHVWFGTEVVRVEPAGGDRWDVTTRSTGGCGSQRTSRYAAVVVANGHNWAPRMPAYEGQESYRGEIIHGSAYKEPNQVRGRKVLVVGGGNTGCDIAVEAATHAARCWHSTRRGYWYAPKYLMGRPTDQVNAGVLRWRLPLWLRQRLMHRVLRLVVGDLTRFGLPRPDHGVFQSHPIVNGQLLHHVGHGGIRPVPEVARFTRHSVILTDGRELDPDLVVMATGYEPRFEFLDPGLLDRDADGRPRLYLHTFPAAQPTLAVAGLVQPDSGVLPLAHWQSVAFARWLRLREAAPQRAARFRERVSGGARGRWKDATPTDSPRHWFEVSHDVYLRELQRALDDLKAVPA
ncbi:flavin-containing monooxygenase [Rhizomonospora bruguierae]|uniref:flavin-containing monooxygenase n=1 Tax=Rhizomonospora bruguierae TaxID=1581705 RepID=UPI0020BE6EA0|nr:NAD(P)-binding domain-containing protein [Micromonospora sp. NBRC 107566]